MPLCGSKEARLAVGDPEPRQFFLDPPPLPSCNHLFTSETKQRPVLTTAVSFGGQVLGPGSYDTAAREDEKEMFRETTSFSSRRPRVDKDWAGAVPTVTNAVDFVGTRELKSAGYPTVPGAMGRVWPASVEPPPPPRDPGLELQSDSLYRPDGSLAEAIGASGLNYKPMFKSSQDRLQLGVRRLAEGQQQMYQIDPAAVGAVRVRDPKRPSATFRPLRQVRPARTKYLPEPYGGAWLTPPPLPPTHRKRPAKVRDPLQPEALLPRDQMTEDTLKRSSSMPSLTLVRQPSRSVPSWSFGTHQRFEVRPSMEALPMASYSEIYR